MRVLFDQGTPAPLRNHLTTHQVSTAYELGWGNLKNGELLQQAENAGYEVLVTTDQNLKYQQNLSARKIAIVVLSATSWPRIHKDIAGDHRSPWQHQGKSIHRSRGAVQQLVARQPIHIHAR